MISAPLRNAAAASAAKPRAAATRAIVLSTRRSGRRAAYPRPARDTRKSANSAANRSCTSVVDMVWPCPALVSAQGEAALAPASSDPAFPPRESSASSASSRVPTPITSTSSPTASRTSSTSAVGHEEHLVAGVADGDRLLGPATDRADGAVEAHGAGDRHPVPAGELARGEHVEHGEGEGQAGRGPADGARVDGDVDREVGTDDAVLGGDADDRPLGVVRRRRSW